MKAIASALLLFASFSTAQATGVVTTSTGAKVFETNASTGCAEAATLYAQEHGIQLDPNRVGLAENVYAGSGSISGLRFWLPVEGLNPGCYIVSSRLSCYAFDGGIRHSTWYAGCPIFDSVQN